MNVEETIKVRDHRYGGFASESEISMVLKGIVRYENFDDHRTRVFRQGWTRLSPAQQSALDLIFLKVARIINGDPTYIDNWHDIGGYALLIERLLEKENSNGSD